MLHLSVALLKQIHLICGTSVLGLSVAQYHYLRRARISKNSQLLAYSTRFSMFTLLACFLLMTVAALTGAQLVQEVATLNWHVRWVLVAISAGIAALGIILLQMLLLKKNAWRSFTACHIILWLILLLIIRDAVFHQTWF